LSALVLVLVLLMLAARLRCCFDKICDTLHA
jgi:hypothetical protein